MNRFAFEVVVRLDEPHRTAARTHDDRVFDLIYDESLDEWQIAPR